jgi:hypothetical protein
VAGCGFERVDRLCFLGPSKMPNVTIASTSADIQLVQPRDGGDMRNEKLDW